MRKFLSFAVVFCTAVLFSSCTKELEDDNVLSVNAGDEITITATAESFGSNDSKTTFSDNPRGVKWVRGDKISLFFGAGTNGGSMFTNTVDDATSSVAKFSGVITAVTLGADDDASVGNYSFTGVYPYKSENVCEVTNDGVLVTTRVPDQQYFRSGTFNDSTFVTMGTSLGLNIAFRSVCSGVSFTVDRDDITSVTLEGNNGEYLAGRVKVGFENGIPVVKQVLAGRTSVTLFAPNGTTFRPGRKYYITTLPAVLPYGIKMTFHSKYEDGVRVWTTAKTFQRNVFTNWNDIETRAEFSSGGLPGGTQFRAKLLSLSGETQYSTRITGISFTTGRDESRVAGAVRINGSSDGAPVYGRFNNGTIEITTTAPGFTVNRDAFKMFADLRGLSFISGMDKLDTRHVKRMMYMFSGCESLLSLDLKGFNTDSVTTIGYMFSGCRSLSDLNLSSFNTSNVTSFVSMFDQTPGMWTVTFGERFVINDSAPVNFFFGSDSESMMGLDHSGPRTTIYCTSSLETKLRSMLGNSVSFYAFADITSRQAALVSVSRLLQTNPSEIHFIANSSERGELLNPAPNALSPIYYTYHDSVVVVTTPAAGFSLQGSCTNLFNSTTLKKIVGLEYFDTQSVTDMSRMFICPLLEELDLSSFNTSEVTKFNYTMSAPNLSTLILGDGFVFDGVSSDGNKWAFFGNGSISYPTMGSNHTTDPRTIIVGSPSTVSELRNILSLGEQAHYDADAVTHYKFVDNTSNVGQLPRGSVFNSRIIALAGEYNRITQIAFVANSSKKGTLINIENTSVPVYATYNAGLVEITTSAPGFQADANSDDMFFNLQNLKSITGLNLLSTQGVSSMNRMFAFCTSLESLDLSGFSISSGTWLTEFLTSTRKLSTLVLGSGFRINSSQRVFGGVGYDYTMMGNAHTPDPRAIITAPSSVIAMVTTALDTDASHYKFVDNASNVGQLPQGSVFNSRIIALAGGYNRITQIAFVANSSKTGTMINIDNTGVPVYATFYAGSVEITTSAPGFQADANSDEMFFNLQNLKSITGLNLLSTQGVSSMNRMFGFCTSLESLDLSNFVVQSNTGLYSFLSSTSRLSSLVLGSSFRINSSHKAFGSVEYVTSMMGNLNTPDPRTIIAASVNTLSTVISALGTDVSHYMLVNTNSYFASLPSGSAFNSRITALAGGYNSITQIAFVANSGKRGTVINSGNGVPIYATYNAGLVEITTPAPGFQAYTISDDMFYNLQNLTSITGLDLLNTQGVTSMKRMFAFCTSLETLDLSNFVMESNADLTDFLATTSKLSTLVLGSGFRTNSSQRVFGNVESATSMMGNANTPDPRTVIIAPSRVHSAMWSGLGADMPHYKIVDNASIVGQLPEGTVFNSQIIAVAGGNSRIRRIVFVANSSKTGTMINIDNTGVPVYATYDAGRVEITTSAPVFRVSSNCDRMFFNLQELTGINDFGLVEAPSVSSMSRMFEYCFSLQALDLGNFSLTTNADLTECLASTSKLQRLLLSDDFRIINTSDHVFGSVGQITSMMGYQNTPDPRTNITASPSVLAIVRAALGTDASHYRYEQ